MKIRQFATITFLVLSSFAADSVTPSKTELESMYDKAFREFDSSNYEQALKDLDAIDARQPDLAESQNLRGVIMMRQKNYPAAETALRKALAADPKFWNARFNLAEIPFLQKNWPEARKRFQELLTGNASELQGEATQLIQYKIMLTHLLEGKQNMVDSMLAKFELTPNTPAVHYANAAIALNKKDENEAKNWLTKAEKDFSPQLNKLFAESLYEVGWLEKPAGQSRAALELNSAADRAASTKAFADAKFDEAEQAFAQRDLTAARRLVDEANAAEPNQPRILNLRGEVLMEQKEFDAAEAEFRKVLKLDPKSRDAQYNLAQVPFKKKEYAKARDRFEALFGVTTGADKDQAAQLIKFKIFLTLLLEGKDARAQKMMEQFQFTGDTPALYYAQAAVEFKNNNTPKANEWVTSARKIYSAPLNGVFADSFYDVGWLQTPSAAAQPAAVVAEAEQPETAPAIEPTPIPSITLAQKAPPARDPLSLAANSAVSGMEATTSEAVESPAASTTIPTADSAATPTAALSPSVETPVASTASPAAARPVIASASESNASDAAAVPAPTAAAATTPATVLAPAQVREWSRPSLSDRLNDRDTLLVGGLFLAAILLIGWVVFAEIRNRMMRAASSRGMVPAEGLRIEDDEATGPIEQFVRPTQLAGGPPRASLKLRASEPALRKAVMPLGKSGRPTPNGAAPVAEAPVAPAPPAVAAPEAFVAPAGESTEGVGEPVEMASFAPPVELPVSREFVPVEESVSEPVEAVSEPVESVTESVPAAFEMPPIVADEVAAPVEQPTAEAQPEATDTVSNVTEPPIETAPEMPVSFAEPAATFDQVTAPEDAPVFEEAPAALAATPVTHPEETIAVVDEQPAVLDEQPAVVDEQPAFIEPPAVVEEPVAEVEQPAPEAEIAPEPAAVAEVFTPAASEPVEEPYQAPEPIGQGQPIPYQVAASADVAPVADAPAVQPEAVPAKPARTGAFGAMLAGIGALRHSVSTPAPAPKIITPEPTAQQPTTPAPMAQPTQPTPAPVIRTAPPAQPGAGAPQGAPAPAMHTPSPQPGGGGMHTAVQLTFSFEIASMQLTPTFKMGALQLKPTSRIVTMRLAPSQNPQPAMNLQVTFEIASVQLNGNAIGMIRLTPSQQQRPGITSTPAFNIAGLQLVAGSDAAPVQMTPAQQGQASVLVTGGFQIATVEFSPSFEIASIILNATSRNVSVQLPGTGPSAVEGAPVFEVGNVQLGGNGEIGMMQLNPQGAGAKRA